MKRTSDSLEHTEVIQWEEVKSTHSLWNRSVNIEGLEKDKEGNERRFVQASVITLGRAEGVAKAIAESPKVPHLNDLGVQEVDSEGNPLFSSIAEHNSAFWNPVEIPLNAGWEIVSVSGAKTSRPK